MQSFKQFVTEIKATYEVGDRVETELGHGTITQMHNGGPLKKGGKHVRAFAKVDHHKFFNKDDQDWKDGTTEYRVMKLRHLKEEKLHPAYSAGTYMAALKHIEHATAHVDRSYYNASHKKEDKPHLDSAYRSLDDANRHLRQKGHEKAFQAAEHAIRLAKKVRQK